MLNTLKHPIMTKIEYASQTYSEFAFESNNIRNKGYWVSRKFQLSPVLGRPLCIDKCDDFELIVKILNKLENHFVNNCKMKTLGQITENSLWTEFQNILKDIDVVQEMNEISRLKYAIGHFNSKSRTTILNSIYFCCSNNKAISDKLSGNDEINSCIHTLFNLIKDVNKERLGSYLLTITSRQSLQVKQFFSLLTLWDFFSKKKANGLTHISSIEQLRAAYNVNENIDDKVNKSFFYKSFKKYGFRYCSIKFTKIYKYSTNNNTKRMYFQIIRHLINNPESFHVLFIDESSIAPGNFQKKTWKIGNGQAVWPTKIKYERIMLMGCMSHRGIESLVFLEENLNSEKFCFFVENTLRLVRLTQGCGKTTVILMDNASCHRSLFLRKFMRKLGVHCVFNLPGHPQANVIEHLWEYLKRDLRKMNNYKK